MYPPTGEHFHKILQIINNLYDICPTNAHKRIVDVSSASNVRIFHIGIGRGFSCINIYRHYTGLPGVPEKKTIWWIFRTFLNRAYHIL